jgi:hypothetical protein
MNKKIEISFNSNDDEKIDLQIYSSSGIIYTFKSASVILKNHSLSLTKDKYSYVELLFISNEVYAK